MTQETQRFNWMGVPLSEYPSDAVMMAIYDQSTDLQFVEGYFCVFVGDPTVSRPYSMFSTKEQAEIFRRSIHSDDLPILTLFEWYSQFDWLNAEGGAE